ncbi:MAG: hypothetical protein ACR2PZ_04185 [Pseudomonadales bacterium]
MKNLSNAKFVALLGCLLGLFAASSSSAQGQNYSDAWGPDLGAQLPMLDAQDHSGTRVQLGDLIGREGLLLVLVRSADW